MRCATCGLDLDLFVCDYDLDDNCACGRQFRTEQGLVQHQRQAHGKGKDERRPS